MINKNLVSAVTRIVSPFVFSSKDHGFLSILKNRNFIINALNNFGVTVPIIKPAKAGGKLNFSAKNFGPKVATPLIIAPSVQAPKDMNRKVGFKTCNKYLE